jgi:exodeoxyribonuclease VII large subunit
LLNPEYILQRGYSITSFNGRVFKDSELVGTDDIVETQLFKGKFKSKIIKKN